MFSWRNSCNFFRQSFSADVMASSGDIPVLLQGKARKTTFCLRKVESKVVKVTDLHASLTRCCWFCISRSFLKPLFLLKQRSPWAISFPAVPLADVARPGSLLLLLLLCCRRFRQFQSRIKSLHLILGHPGDLIPGRYIVP